MMKDLSMHVLDIVQNSIRANASCISVTVTEDSCNKNLYIIEIGDDGDGMTEEFVAQVRNPFTTSRTTRKVGLGIPMLEQTCISCGGTLTIKSEVGVGTTITAAMQYDNIDRPPSGDIGGAMHILIVTNPSLDFFYTHRHNGNEYVLSTREVKEVLGDVPLSEPDVMLWLKENITEGLAEIGIVFV